MITVAFYKGHGTALDWLIRTATRSAYSHCELICGGLDDLGGAAAVSASFRDGGVRVKWITFHPERWDMVAMPWADPASYSRALSHSGAGYDLTGILLSQLIGLRRQDAARWFCSELIGWSLGLAMPETLSPGEMFARATDMNRAYLIGRALA